MMKNNKLVNFFKAFMNPRSEDTHKVASKILQRFDDEKDISIENIEKIFIKTTCCPIIISSSDFDDEITAHFNGSAYLDGKVNFNFERKSNKELIISLDIEGKVKNCDFSLNIGIPKTKIFEKISIETTVGPIEFIESGIHAKTLQVESTVGDVRITGCYNNVVTTTVNSKINADLEANSNINIFLRSVSGMACLKLGNIGKLHVSGKRVEGNVCNKHKSSKGNYKANISYETTCMDIIIK